MSQSHYKWDFHFEFKQLRALKISTVSKMNEVERFMGNVLTRDRTWEPKTCWNELHRDIEDLLKFKEWAEAKVQQLEDNILGDSETAAKYVHDVGIVTPVTDEKVKGSLQREFDGEVSRQYDKVNEDMV